MLVQDKLQGRTLDLTMRDGRKMAGELFVKSGAGAASGVVMVPAVFGIDDDARQIAWDYANAGHPVLALDIFFRIHAGPLAREGEGREKAMARYAAFDAEQGAKDVGDSVAALRKMAECNGKVAVFGYCFGGRMAFLAAALGLADGAASFHGTKIGVDLDKAKSVACPLQLHCGDVDPQIPMDEVEATRAALAGKVGVEVSIYGGAAHGFTGKGRPSFHAVADSASRQAALRLLGGF